MSELKKISATALATFLACPQRYYYRYVAPRGTGVANKHLIAGTGFHAAIEYAITKLLAGEDCSLEDAVMHGMSVAQEEYVAYPLSADLLAFSPEVELDEILCRVRRAATWYLETQLDKLRPVSSEWKFSLPIPYTDWHLVGKIDCIEEDGLIRDFKLSGSKNPPAMDIADRSEQLSVYALAAWLRTGSVPPAVVLDFCRDGLTRMGCIERVGTRSEKDCIRTLTRIRRVIDCIEKGVYGIPSREGIECNGSRCDFYLTCPFGMGKIE